VLDGGGGSFNLFYWQRFGWHCYNFVLKNVASGYRLFYRTPTLGKNLIFCDTAEDCIYGEQKFMDRLEDCYAYGFGRYFLNSCDLGCLENVHVQGTEGADRYALRFSHPKVLKACSFGKVIPLTTLFYAMLSPKIQCEQIDYDLTESIVNWSTNAYPSQYHYISFSGYNGNKDKFRQYYYNGEIYNVDEDAAIDPPSGATTYIKIVPNSRCNSLYPLVHKEERYQSGTSKTYTWKVLIWGYSSFDVTDVEVEAWYLEESTGIKRKYSTANLSTATISDETNQVWNDLSITISPGQAGMVYFQIKLKKYELGAFIALDPKPSVS